MEHTAGDNPSSTGIMKVIISWAGIFLVMSVFYAVLAQRGPSWQDSGEFQWRILTEDYPGGLGLVRSHPLYITAGRAVLAVSGEKNFCWAINAFSGVGMAAALANIVWIGWLLTKKLLPGFLCAAMLAVCHTPWWLSEVAEVYTWSLALFTAELAILTLLWRNPRVWKLCVLALLAGLELSIHNFALLAYPVYFVVAIVLVARRRLPLYSLLLALPCWAVGAGMWIGMIAWLVSRTGSVVYSVKNALVGDYGKFMFASGDKDRYMMMNVIFSLMNFVNLLPLLILAGFWRIFRKLGAPLAWIYIAVIAIHLAFFIGYRVPDKFTFILPSLGLLTVVAVIGLDAFMGLGPRWKKLFVTLCLASAILSPVVYMSAAATVKKYRPSLAAQRWAFRDEVNYWLIPWKFNENSAVLFSREKLDGYKPSEKVRMDEATSLYPMLVVQIIEARRPDVLFVSSCQPGGEFREQIYSPQRKK